MQRKFLIGSLLTLAFAVACGGSNTPNPVSPSISISPTSVSAKPGDGPTTFTATVNNSTGSVVWSLTPSDASAGTLSTTSGTSTTYTPPATLSSALTVTLTATIANTPYQAAAQISLSNGSANATGTIAITVSTNTTGVDAGALDAGILVLGPSFTRTLAGSATLKVVPGPYSVTASNAYLQDPIVGSLFSALVTPSGTFTVASTGSTNVNVLLTQRPETGKLWVPGNNGAIVAFSAAELRLDAGTSLTPATQVAVNGTDSIQALAFDHAGNVWVTDETTRELRGYTFADGGATRSVTISGFTGSPRTLSFAPNGDAYVGDYSNNQIIVIPAAQLTTSGTVMGAAKFIASLTDAGRPSISSPDDSVVDSQGTLWLLNGNDYQTMNSISRFYADGGLASYIVDDQSTPTVSDLSGLSFDTAGNLWVGGYGTGNIVKLNVANLPTGTTKLKDILLGKLSSSSLSNNIQSLTFDSSGGLWVYSLNGHLDYVANPNAELDAGTFVPTKSFTGGPNQATGPGRIQFNPPVAGIGLYP